MKLKHNYYDRVAERIRNDPYGPFNKPYRSWIGRYHIRYGRMPPVDLRSDWPNVPSWAK